LPEAKKLKLNKTHFIINVKQKMDESVSVAKIRYSGKNIYDLLNLTIDEAAELFKGNKLIRRKLGFLQEVGLGYLCLGQKSGT